LAADLAEATGVGALADMGGDCSAKAEN